MLRDRVSQEEAEERLSPYAARSAAARRRDPAYRPDPYRTEFARDRDRILHSHHFRLLAHKTQVIPTPPPPLATTRLTHTLEVMQAARSLCRSLGMNEDLAEAIALGHDLGHAPFGHAGEDTLRRIMQRAGAGGFEHNEHSLRVVDALERLDLTEPTRQGILCHTQYDPADYPAGRELPPELTELGYAPRGTLFTRPRTLEAQVVDLADEIAYLAHDTEDMRRAGLFTGDLPDRLALFLSSKRELLSSLIHSLTRDAARQLADAAAAGDAHPRISFHPELAGLVAEFKAFSAEHFYRHPYISERCRRSQGMLETLFARWLERPPTEPLASDWPALDDLGRHRRLLDFICSLTEGEVERYYADGAA